MVCFFQEEVLAKNIRQQTACEIIEDSFIDKINNETIIDVLKNYAPLLDKIKSIVCTPVRQAS